MKFATAEICDCKGGMLISIGGSNEKPRIGVGGAKMTFIHPKGAKVLMELVEH